MKHPVLFGDIAIIMNHHKRQDPPCMCFCDGQDYGTVPFSLCYVTPFFFIAVPIWFRVYGTVLSAV